MKRKMTFWIVVAFVIAGTAFTVWYRIDWYPIHSLTDILWPDVTDVGSGSNVVRLQAATPTPAPTFTRAPAFKQVALPTPSGYPSWVNQIAMPPEVIGGVTTPAWSNLQARYSDEIDGSGKILKEIEITVRCTVNVFEKGTSCGFALSAFLDSTELQTATKWDNDIDHTTTVAFILPDGFNLTKIQTLDVDIFVFPNSLYRTSWMVVDMTAPATPLGPIEFIPTPFYFELMTNMPIRWGIDTYENGFVRGLVNMPTELLPYLQGIYAMSSGYQTEVILKVSKLNPDDRSGLSDVAFESYDQTPLPASRYTVVARFRVPDISEGGQLITLDSSASEEFSVPLMFWLYRWQTPEPVPMYTCMPTTSEELARAVFFPARTAISDVLVQQAGPERYPFIKVAVGDKKFWVDARNTNIHPYELFYLRQASEGCN